MFYYVIAYPNTIPEETQMEMFNAFTTDKINMDRVHIVRENGSKGSNLHYNIITDTDIDESEFYEYYQTQILTFKIRHKCGKLKRNITNKERKHVFFRRLIKDNLDYKYLRYTYFTKESDHKEILSTLTDEYVSDMLTDRKELIKQRKLDIKNPAQYILTGYPDWCIQTYGMVKIGDMDSFHKYVVEYIKATADMFVLHSYMLLRVDAKFAIHDTLKTYYC